MPEPKGGADQPGVVAPPLAVFAAFFAAGLGLEWLWPCVLAFTRAGWPAGVAAIVAGIALVAWSMHRFRRSETTVNPYGSTRAIVSDGPYRFSRNPIYLALVLIYVGGGIAVGSLWVLALLVPCLAVMHWGVILREERYLENKFGDDYRRYKASVRRWL